tara:strand:+ start:182 stop:931 length:750 start_codon:yes stop_codon:yes gene_type:complete
MNVLYLDLEHGSQTLGSEKAIEDMFSFPVLSPSTWKQFQSLIGQLYTTKNTIKTKMVGTLEIKEESSTVVPKNGTKIDAFVVDTFSELSKKYVRELSGDDGKLKLQGWGQLKNKLDGALEFISRIPGTVVLNCHAKVQTMDDGNKVIPFIDGSTKEDISKWFDFVFYTKNVKNGAGTEYKWVTRRDEKYDHAKDRTNLLDDIIPQDYQLIINAAKERGFNGCKILIVGSPGSGKTWSLKTLTSKGTKKT